MMFSSLMSRLEIEKRKKKKEKRRRWRSKPSTQ